MAWRIRLAAIKQNQSTQPEDAPLQQSEVSTPGKQKPAIESKDVVGLKKLTRFYFLIWWILLFVDFHYSWRLECQRQYRFKTIQKFWQTGNGRPSQFSSNSTKNNDDGLLA
jgi:hypothetical protein